ncbi:DNA polymerase III subunit delta' [Macrococcoides caseolyticum]|uniref:DNA polymerase III subunit delta' n=1 Tax=Macrococcoides caseolyticum TaxID=69966 RepID=UPI001F2695AA|nr:DNA polymerase III subunit delta' [Macrococcus caseolyticus]MCE4957928.1 DNA polymerase III subunit delta' [Macrococcus caseolyticus]
MHTQLQYLVESNKLSHAYLLDGQNRSQLKEEAMNFAKAILCKDNEVCRSKVEQLNHSDFLLLETSEATIKKEMIENVLHRMNQKPIEGTYKVYIIMDFDKVTAQGENSILKFLEEPPENTIAILVTTSPKLILPTIHSRCQHIFVQAMQNNLFEHNINIPKSLLATMNALNFSQEEAVEWHTVHDFKEIKSVIIKWCQMLLNSDTMGLIQIVNVLDLLDNRDKQLLGIDLMQLYLQDLMYALVGNEVVSFPESAQLIQQQANNLTVQQCVNMIDHTLQAKQRLLQYVNVTLVYEEMAIEMLDEVK